MTTFVAAVPKSNPMKRSTVPRPAPRVAGAGEAVPHCRVGGEPLEESAVGVDESGVRRAKGLAAGVVEPLRVGPAALGRSDGLVEGGDSGRADGLRVYEWADMSEREDASDRGAASGVLKKPRIQSQN